MFGNFIKSRIATSKWISICILFAVPLIGWVVMSAMEQEHVHRSDRIVIAMLSDDACLDNFDKPGRWVTKPPAVIGFIDWTGQTSLSCRCAAFGVPWFERIVRIDICEDSSLQRGDVMELTTLKSLRVVAIHDSHKSMDFYMRGYRRHSRTRYISI